MTKQIPEKTIEIWTTFSLVHHLGPRTRIWSWPTGADQIVSTADLRKWFMLELKAPEDADSPYIIVDLAQLSRYVGNHQKRSHPDTLYVLPSRLQGRVPHAFASVPADPGFQRWFCHNAYVIRATELARLLKASLNSSPPARSARIRCDSGSVEYRGRLPSHSVKTSALTLHDTLQQIRDCSEPFGMALRSGVTVRRTPTGEGEGDDEPLLLSLETIQRSLQTVAMGRPGRLLLVGHT